jgi:hypothetical protein
MMTTERAGEGTEGKIPDNLTNIHKAGAKRLARARVGHAITRLDLRRLIINRWKKVKGIRALATMMRK